MVKNGVKIEIGKNGQKWSKMAKFGGVKKGQKRHHFSSLGYTLGLIIEPPFSKNYLWQDNSFFRVLKNHDFGQKTRFCVFGGFWGQNRRFSGSGGWGSILVDFWPFLVVFDRFFGFKK